jgi:hypothetical protein
MRGWRELVASLTCAIGLMVMACGDDGSGITGLQPEILSIAPDSGNVGTMVEILGSGFEVGVRAAFGDWESDSVVFIDGTTLLAFAPDSVKLGETYNVTVVNPGGKWDDLSTAYKGVAPALQVMNGVSKPAGSNGSTIILEGQSFGDLLGKGRVFFTDDGGQPVEAPVSMPDNWTNAFVVTTVPNSAATGPVWIETPTGATDSITFTVTQAATFSPSQILWTETQSLPNPGQGHGAVFFPIDEGAGAGNLVYVTGGADGALATQATVASAEIDAGGDFSTYTTATALPQGRAFHGATSATPFNALIDTLVAGYLYVVGGIDDAGAATSTIYKATVDKDRSVGTWTTTTPLPVPLHSMGATIFRSWLYVAGGASTGNVPQSEVYRARINEDGTLGDWETQASLPYARAYAPLIQFAGVLYVLGGETGTVAPGDNSLTATRTADIHYHRLDLRTGELKNLSWSQNPGSLIKDVSKHSAVAVGGTILVSGGIYGGAANSATEQQYASINLDGTIGSFGGATGSHTIAGSSGAGGVPFFHHAAIGYIDASDVAHVVIIGGNNVEDPAIPVANTYFY